jgi:hypothetical protein
MSHTSRYVRSNGATVAFAFNKAKQYKMSSAGVITELADGVDAGDEELAIPGSKAHLRRLDLVERNVTLVGSKTLTTDGGTGSTITAAAIAKAGTNGSGDIGTTGNRFGTVWGTAVSAQYADLAEKYEADAEIEAGTVVHFGGEKEVSTCDQDHCTRVAGVVSTAPGYKMNDGLEAEHVAYVALTGRVPCKVTGPVAKGDMMVSAGNGMARAEANPTYGAVIGKALENWEGGEGVIEVVVK